ncbi:hypothetical protein ABIE65_001373 [Constrictibacter sp. MBR-5]|jgi:hypothetical protein|uniref:hypothetical protein n=1 Tax=Constrictibacter sp. MBR-5 TaxID=3156467 RepID=UPI00339284FB
MSEPFLSSNPEFDLIGYCEHIMPDGRRCRHSAQIDRAAMLVRFGDMPRSEFARRMRCPAGHRGGSVRLGIRGDSGSPWEAWPVQSGQEIPKA